MIEEKGLSPTARGAKLIRVELEYDTGEIETLTGDDAQAWLKQIDDVLIFVQISRNWKIKGFEWSKTNAKI